MKQNIAENAKRLVERQIQEAGFALWDVRYEKEAGVWNLVFELEKLAEGEDMGMTMADCERANNIIEPIIDKADPIEGAYTLEVSSAGLTRRLRTECHFETALKKNWDVRLKLYKAETCAGVCCKEINGVITRIGEDEITIDDITISRKNIASAEALLG